MRVTSIIVRTSRTRLATAADIPAIGIDEWARDSRAVSKVRRMRWGAIERDGSPGTGTDFRTATIPDGASPRRESRRVRVWRAAAIRLLTVPIGQPSSLAAASWV